MHQKFIVVVMLLLIHKQLFCWGFYAHKIINRQAVFSLPPSMMVFYKPNIDFITEHAVDPDKRRYIVAEEGSRHYIDINTYGNYPFSEVPKKWQDAVIKFGEDSLYKHGIVPWWINIMQQRLTNAFMQKNHTAILKLSTEIAHYVGDAHVPLHTHNNYNGQLTGQHGIHGFWESRIPELLAAQNFDYFVGKAEYIQDPQDFIWRIVYESALASDSVLSFEKTLSNHFPSNQKYAFEERNGVIIRQYSSASTIAYNNMLNDMVQRRMRQSIFAVASLWYTAWVNAGQPQLIPNAGIQFSAADSAAFQQLDEGWQSAKTTGRTCEN